MMTLSVLKRGTISRMRILGIFCAVSMAWGATPDQIRTAAAKALTIVQSSQKNWYVKQSCTSCHQQLLPEMAVAAAREHNIPFDEAAARAETAKTSALYADLDQAVQYTYVIDPAQDDALHLIAANASGISPNLVTAVYARHIGSYQLPDGHWTTSDVRPPQSYSDITATANSLRALQLYAHPSLATETKSRIEKARAWLSSATPHDTQERVDRLTGLWRGGADAALLKKLATELKSRQRPDGGWNSRDGLGSDAYSTGVVLIALNDAVALAVSDAVFQRGVQFLLSTQAADGSWHVLSRLRPPAPVSPPYFETGFPYGHDQYISTMGTAWAVMAMARAAGPGKPANAAMAVNAGTEPWMETMLFGSAADVRALLDKKFDPNSATRSGGTTALMLAMPDAEKAKMLIERGANLNARAKTRYSALMVAAQYPGSGAAMNYLLGKGAQVRMAKGAGAPLFNASPLMLATIARNSAMIAPLKKAGDDVDAKMSMLGLFPSVPLLVAVGFGDLASVRGLLDAGASANSADDDNISALAWAAISNRTEVARLLIERGADVNHADTKGMTPLLYAASIDFGDSAMIDALLKAGANPKAKTREGLTAAALASKYGHAHVTGHLPSD
jgi:ankyrin repeat protein